jgi:hypothetical protein
MNDSNDCIHMPGLDCRWCALCTEGVRSACTCDLCMAETLVETLAA